MISGLKQQIKDKLPFAVKAVRAARWALKQRLSLRYVHQVLGERKDIYIEVGSGDKPGTNGWITLDMTPNCDVYWDLRKGIPFPTESVSKIYSSHFFEHLSFTEAQKFLDECRRVLVADGKFLICVPNARRYLEAYLNDQTLDSNVWFAYKPAYNGTTKIDYVNYVAYMDGHHKYMFDPENVIHILESKGFRNVRFRPFDASLDQADRDFESIYAEAEK